MDIELAVRECEILRQCGVCILNQSEVRNEARRMGFTELARMDNDMLFKLIRNHRELCEKFGVDSPAYYEKGDKK